MSGARINRAKRSIKVKQVYNNSDNISCFKQVISRNEDFYNHIIARDCNMNDLFIVVDTALPSFILQLIISSQEDEVHTYEFEIKKANEKVMTESIQLLAGDRLRFDIKDIDSVYENATNMGIGFMLNFESK